MYHLFVTGEDGAWEASNVYELPLSRYLEHTEQTIVGRFQHLTQSGILEEMRQWPCMFAYEGTRGSVRFGTLGEVSVRPGTPKKIRFEFAIDSDEQAIPFSILRPFMVELKIGRLEMNRTHWAIKEVDLDAVLRQAGIPIRMEPRGENIELPSPPANDAFDGHEPIRSLDQFVGWVIGSASDDRDVFFRGHAKTEYKLEPRLFRTDKAGNPLYITQEDLLYRELLVSNSADFRSDVYTLDRLVRMQHYSLPTRLLDITSNALIALYFACKAEADDRDVGEVILFSIARDTIKYFDSDTASCVANLARMSYVAQRHIRCNETEVEPFNEQEEVKRLVHFIKEEKPYFERKINPKHLQTILCVKGKRSNDRISSQAGAFLLFGNDATLAEGGTEDITVSRIRVTGKKQLRAQLDRMNINESTVFPYIESSARYIAEKFAFRADDAGL
jgi:hypothetical protein